MIILFWTCFFLLFYTYFLFPVFVILFSKNKSLNSEVFKNLGECPSVSILIAAYNEQAVIEEKIQSIIDSNFPHNKLEIIVGSDCSSDNTNQIIEQLSEKYPFIKLKIFETRTGKSGVVNQLIKLASNKIIILTDANIIFSKKTIFSLIKHFKNKKIGLVDSNMVNRGIKKSGISLQEKTYISTEVKFKHAESKLWGMLMGPFGGCFAIRKELFSPIPTDFLVDDFFVCMNILSKQFQAINDLDAVVFEEVSNHLSEEIRRKRRISTGNFKNLFYFKHLLNPFKKLGFVFISHKVIRWIGSLVLLLMFWTNFTLKDEHSIYLFLLIAQAVLFLIPIIDYIFRKIGIHILILRFITHFYSMNFALLLGLFDFLFQSKSGLWEPTKRKQDEI